MLPRGALRQCTERQAQASTPTPTDLQGLAHLSPGPRSPHGVLQAVLLAPWPQQPPPPQERAAGAPLLSWEYWQPGLQAHSRCSSNAEWGLLELRFPPAGPWVRGGRLAGAGGPHRALGPWQMGSWWLPRGSDSELHPRLLLLVSPCPEEPLARVTARQPRTHSGQHRSPCGQVQGGRVSSLSQPVAGLPLSVKG